MFDASLLFLANDGKSFSEILKDLWHSTGVAQSDWRSYFMLAIAAVLVYLAIGKKFEPLLLLPIAFGMFLINIPGAYGILHTSADGSRGLFSYLSDGLNYVIYPPLIFLGVGAMTDFGPLIANPKSMIMGAGAQVGLYITFLGALLLGFTGAEAASISIIGGADGPTTIYLTTKLAKDLLPIVALAAYSYMALIPLIQPPVMKLLTTKKERMIRMEQMRPVSKIEKICFPLVVTAVIGIILPAAIPLLGMLMLGNLFRESGVVNRLVETASNSMINILTIILGIVVGSKAIGAPPAWASESSFLSFDTLKIIGLGLIAFMLGTATGVLTAKIMNKFSRKKINPLIGSAAVSAVPMAARVSQKVGQDADPENYLLMHAMGPNVAGIISTAIVAGLFLAVYL